MKKLFVIVIALMAFFAAIQTLAEEDGYFILCRPGSVVNVRNSPDMNASVAGWVEFGTFVHTDGQEINGFVHVVDLAAETTEGWIFSGYLVYDRPREERYTAEVWGGNVIARKSIGGKRIRTLREGQRVTVYARSNAWAYTNKGYVMCDWLREVD